MSITSDEVNYLVYRYLQESGFIHASYVFGHESHVVHSDINAGDIPPGALISLLIKGLQYVEVEAHLDENGVELEDGQFDLADLTRRACGEGLLESAQAHGVDVQSTVAKAGTIRPIEAPIESAAKKQRVKEEPKTEASSTSTSMAMTVATAIDRGDDVTTKGDNSGEYEAAVQFMRGHTSEVIACSFSSRSDILASASYDSTARLWELGPASTINGNALIPEVTTSAVVLKHLDVTNEEAKVTTLDWSPDANFLATGSYDGHARLWTLQGELKCVFHRHTGPIFSLKWCSSGSLLLTGSFDCTAIVWDASSGHVKQQFSFHSAPVLDVTWQDGHSFATCSEDKEIHVCRLGSTEPVKTFRGHTDTINAVTWDAAGRLLASCSDDRTAKVWSLSQDSPLFDLCDHTQEVYTTRWCPPNSSTRAPVLATASFDNTVRIYEMEKGTCLCVLSKHTDKVYCISFSPDGRYLASGSHDKYLHVWSTNDGSIVKSYKGDGVIYELTWSASGNRVAACTSHKSLFALDINV